MTLSPSQIEEIAERLAEALEDRGLRPWGDVKTVARELGVQEEWVYENARRLGGVKLGPGRGARWRFEMARLRRIVASGALEEDGIVSGLAASDSNGTGPALNGAAPKPRTRPPARPPEDGFDDAPAAMAKLDLTGRFTALNPAFSKVIGYSEEQFGRARWPSPLDREDFAEQSRALRELAAGKLDQVSFRSSFLHGQGLVVQIAGRLALVRGSDGKPSHLLLVADQREE